MKRLVIFLLFIYTKGIGQNNAFSNEDFVNAIAWQVVDSSFHHYYLFSNAAPCSFKRFDYDEWYKYGLLQDVPLYSMNELAKKCFLDAAPRSWQPEKLLNARCIDEKRAADLLSMNSQQAVKNTGRRFNENNVVFCFSRPAFTDDYQYAVIDCSIRCDAQQCGMGATLLFRQVNGKWILAGKKLAWGNE